MAGIFVNEIVSVYEHEGCATLTLAYQNKTQLTENTGPSLMTADLINIVMPIKQLSYLHLALCKTLGLPLDEASDKYPLQTHPEESLGEPLFTSEGSSD